MKSFAIKISLASLALSALLVFIVAQFSSMAWPLVLLRAVLLSLVLLMLFALYAVLAAKLKRFLLNHGAIDSQWLWFADYPPGFLRYFRIRK